MKILFISSDSKICEPQSKVRDRLRAYAALTDSLIVVSSAHRSMQLNEGNLFLHTFADNRIVYFFLLPFRIRHIIRTRMVDVISTQDPFEHGLLALLATIGTGVRVHMQLHTDPFAPGFVSGSTLGVVNLIRRILLSVTIPRACRVRVVSERLKDEIEARWKIPVSVIPVMVQELVSEPTSVPKDLNSFITIGRLAPEKNVEDIISSFARIVSEFPEATLTVLGDGPRKKFLTQLTERLRVQKSVTFLGHTSSVADILARKQVYVHASSYEGYGLTLIEAALGELPIITTDVGVVGDVLTHNESALVYRPHDIDSLCTHMKALLENPERQITLGQEGAKRVREHLAQYANVPEMVVRDLKACIKSSS
ncbi:MAG: glycosyltransferase [Candidatus Pacebacteria bacterium]|nr:glycosyltransferase [Candidatus Paceibacterota bacterium]